MTESKSAVRLELLTNVVLIACALAAVALVARQSSSSSARSSSLDERQESPSPVVLSDSEWVALRAVAGLTDDKMPNQLVIFVDVECPFCARYHATVDSFSRISEPPLSVGFAHFPLSQHRFSHRGAVALECAGGDVEFKSLLRTLYEHQDSIGLLSWAQLAARAGNVDTTAFSSCTADPRISARVDASLELAKRIGARGTPAVVLNGELLPVLPSVTSLKKRLR